MDSAKAQTEAQEKRKRLSEKEEKLAAQVNKGPKVIANKVTKVKVGEENLIGRGCQSCPFFLQRLQLRLNFLQLVLRFLPFLLCQHIVCFQ